MSDSYPQRVGLAGDQFSQALAQKGIYGISISARAGTALRRDPPHRWACVLCKWLEKIPFFGLNHCENAIGNDCGRLLDALESLAPDVSKERAPPLLERLARLQTVLLAAVYAETPKC
jgi:hypothetical protein